MSALSAQVENGNGAPCGVCGEMAPGRFRIWFDGDIKLYRCRSCGFVAQFPGPGRGLLGSDAYADGYDLDFSATQEFKYPRHRRGLQDILGRLAAIRKDGDVLDVGCGDGQFLTLLAGAGYRCQGIEPSRLAAYAAQKSGARVQRGFYDEEAYPAGTFDVITMIQVLEHMPAPRASLAAAWRHLRPGGLMIIEVPSITAPGFLAYRLTGIKRFVAPPGGVIPSHLGYYSPRTLSHLLALGGFDRRSLWTGRWRCRYTGFKQRLGWLLDPILQITGIGGLLCIGEKRRG